MIDFIGGTYLESVYFGNTVASYIDVILYFVIALVVLFVFQRFLMAQFEKFSQQTTTEVDDVLVEFIQSIRPRLYIIVSLYVALSTLQLNAMAKGSMNAIMIIAVLFQVTRSAQIVIEFFAKKLNGGEDEHVQSAAQLLNALIVIVVWIFGIMMILSNIGINITSLIAGVGIGGIAVAFAVKELLSDLFSSFSIYFDKPFKAGDTVKVNDEVGKIKKIGVKTTRIISRTGEELVIPNQDMTSSCVHNYKKMDHRNVRTHLSVAFDTPTEVLRAIPDAITEIVNGVPHAECKRVHLKKFSEWGLVFETLYVIDSSDYTTYMDAQHTINIGIKELCDARGIAIASPLSMRDTA